MGLRASWPLPFRQGTMYLGSLPRNLVGESTARERTLTNVWSAGELRLLGISQDEVPYVSHRARHISLARAGGVTRLSPRGAKTNLPAAQWHQHHRAKSSVRIDPYSERRWGAGDGRCVRSVEPTTNRDWEVEGNTRGGEGCWLGDVLGERGWARRTLTKLPRRDVLLTLGLSLKLRSFVVLFISKFRASSDRIRR